MGQIHVGELPGRQNHFQKRHATSPRGTPRSREEKRRRRPTGSDVSQPLQSVGSRPVASPVTLQGWAASCAVDETERTAHSVTMMWIFIFDICKERELCRYRWQLNNAGLSISWRAAAASVDGETKSDLVIQGRAW